MALKNVEPLKTSMVGSGNERSQSHSLGKITFQSVDRAESPPHNTIVAPIE